MKVDRLETHDRLSYFTKQDFDIGKTCQEMIDRRPFGDHPFYIFAHKRQLGLDERMNLLTMALKDGYACSMDKIPTDRMIWQPRLTKPKAEENSLLVKAYPGTDIVKIIWILPARELWSEFEKGKMTENKTVWESIQSFLTDKEGLERPEEDDYSDEAVSMIYMEIAKSAKQQAFRTSLIAGSLGLGDR